MAIGNRVYGLGAVALGIQGLVFGSFGVMGLAAPAHLPAAHVAAYVSAALLVLAGLAVNVGRTAAIGSLALAGFFALWTLAFALPSAVAEPTVWVSWENLAESTVKALGGVLAFLLVGGLKKAPGAAIARTAAPRVFGLCLVVFGVSEFVYAKFTASLVPAWLPPSQLVWTYLTGAAQIAAGFAILANVQARLAAMALTAMYVGFSLLVHFPRVLAQPSSHGAWAESGTNLVLAGAAWCLAESLGRSKGRG